MTHLDRIFRKGFQGTLGKAIEVTFSYVKAVLPIEGFILYLTAKE